MVRINGEEKDGAAGRDLQDVLDALGYQRDTYVAEVNGVIYARGEMQGHELHDGDVVEVVTFMGGG